MPVRDRHSLFGPQDLPYKRKFPREQEGFDVDTPLPPEPRSVLSPPVSPTTLRTMMVIIGIVGAIFLSRLASLQVLRGSEYRTISEENRLRIEWMPAARGLIYDRGGALLVSNEPQLNLVLSPQSLPRDLNTRKEIATLLQRLEPRIDDTTVSVITEVSNVQRGTVPLLDGLDQKQAVKIVAYTDELPGIQVNTELMRFTRQGESLSHVVGFVGRIDQESFSRLKNHPLHYQQNDFVGRTGIEQYYEEIVRGAPGRRVVEVDAQGEVKATIAQEPPVRGSDLTLTLSASLQDVFFRALTREVRARHGTGGAAVALDPRNGEVLALVSTPSFDARAFASGDAAYVRSIMEHGQYPLFNRANAGQYPTGSTIKPIIAAAALHEKIMTASTLVSSTGGLRVGKWFFPDWKAGGHGWVNLRTALAESVNTYFYVIGGGYEEREGLGIDRMVHYAGKFNFGTITGIDILGEARGFLPTKEWKEKTKGESWYVGDTYHFAIGQGDVLATPLQIALMTAVFANGGDVLLPHLVRNSTRSFIKENLVANDILTREDIDEVNKGLREAVRTGSARSLSDFPIAIAGKTGTAQVGGTMPPHAWFTAYAPYDQPEIVITVIVEQGGEGSAVAVPVAREGFTWWYQHRND
ncbi:MAG: penicillin-binding protein 2 [Patescibacteria group bacterium]